MVTISANLDLQTNIKLIRILSLTSMRLFKSQLSVKIVTLLIIHMLLEQLQLQQVLLSLEVQIQMQKICSTKLNKKEGSKEVSFLQVLITRWTLKNWRLDNKISRCLQLEMEPGLNKLMVLIYFKIRRVNCKRQCL